VKVKVLLAGATGAIGRPLTRALIGAGHEVLGLARSENAAAKVTALGAQPVHADALDRDALLRALDGLRADAVIHQLTALKRPKLRLGDSDPNTRLRVQGTANLLAAAGALGARRFLTQSLILGYGYRDHGSKVLTEKDTFGVLSGGMADVVVKGLRSTEEQTLGAQGIEGIALRYGVFYGPGTWFDPTPGAATIPVPASGGSMMSWIHVEDAATATVAALERGAAGQAYNVVDDSPMTWSDKAAAVATHGAKARRVPGWLMRFVPYLGRLTLHTTMLVSHEKATGELNWSPRHPVTPPP
jgi:nucleoside-diphosphate-sugar epimerase